MPRLWFASKRYGWGWVPVTIEGWLVTLGFIGLILLNSLRFDEPTLQQTSKVVEFLAETFLLVGALIAICFWKGEKPRWRWGK